MKKVVLIIVALIVIFFGWRVVVYFWNIGKTAVQQELALAQVSGDNYTFYYPKGWVAGQESGAKLTYLPASPIFQKLTFWLIGYCRWTA